MRRRRRRWAGRASAGRRGPRPTRPRRPTRPTGRRQDRAEPDVITRPHGLGELTAPGSHGLLRGVTDTDVRLWRRVHMDLVRYAGCVCRPSC
ncbi:putative leader peptide [Streptomyces jeddahensis]|uniref:putative leader peptide n=1 Tax=Streptomyces jeddahensis TaxID=1716141 RepID=UPI002FCCE6D7